MTVGKRGSNYNTAREALREDFEVGYTDSSRREVASLYREFDENRGLHLEDRDGRPVVKMSKEASSKLDDQARRITDRIVFRDQQMERDYRAIKDATSGSYYLSPKDRSNIVDAGQYLSSRENSLKVQSRDSSRTGIDTLYGELSSRFPAYFSEERHSNPADQLQHINQVLRDLRESSRTPASQAMSRSQISELQSSVKREIIQAYARKEYLKQLRKKGRSSRKAKS